LSVLVVQTGIGPACARRALEWVLSRPAFGGVAYRPRLIVSAGFSGALADGYRVGDLVVAHEVSSATGQCWPATWPGKLDGVWQPPLRRGRIVTASHLVATTEEKTALGKQTGAVAVDMECAAIAELCTRHGVPFGCVRVISDDVATAVSPGLARVLSAGRVSLGRLGLALVRSPRMVGELWRLSRQTRLAAHQLSLALGELLSGTPAEKEP
jgi:adenosylhomocysteine nucleosidase